jgi:hypothetical protein
VDKCGPAGDSWLARLISWLVPDKLFGVNLAECCAQHDIEYSNSDRRKWADENFRICIKCKFKWYALQKGSSVLYQWKRLQGFIVSWWYFIAVRVAGWTCHNKDK